MQFHRDKVLRRHKQWKVPKAFWNQKDKELVRSLELSSLPANGALILAAT